MFALSSSVRSISTFGLVVVLFAMLAGCARNSLPDWEPESISDNGKLAPVDWEDTIHSARWYPANDPSQWLTPWRASPISFDEMIYSWSVSLPEEEGFRLYLRVRFTDDEVSPWLYAGYWGDVDLVDSRQSPRFEHGRLLLDHLFLNKHAGAYQFRLVDEGRRGLTVLPSLHAVVTDNDPDSVPAMLIGDPAPDHVGGVVLDLPLRRQETSEGVRMRDRCQSAAIATAMEYLGFDVATEDIEALIYDPEYRHPGIWPRIIASATQHGLDGYITRFRDWDSVDRAIRQNHLVLASITMPASLDYIAPPYAQIGGHIVVVNGLTDDGRVVVTDSALGRTGAGYLCQWLIEDFEKVWMDQKGGVAMVILPPPGAPRIEVAELDEFPGDRRATNQPE